MWSLRHCWSGALASLELALPVPRSPQVLGLFALDPLSSTVSPFEQFSSPEELGSKHHVNLWTPSIVGVSPVALGWTSTVMAHPPSESKYLDDMNASISVLGSNQMHACAFKTMMNWQGWGWGQVFMLLLRYMKICFLMCYIYIYIKINIYFYFYDYNIYIYIYTQELLTFSETPRPDAFVRWARNSNLK